MHLPICTYDRTGEAVDQQRDQAFGELRVRLSLVRVRVRVRLRVTGLGELRV